MDDLFLKWVLFEWRRDRYERTGARRNRIFKEIANYTVNLLILQRWIPVLSLRTLATSLVRLGRDHAF